MTTDSTNFVVYVSSPENKHLDDVINYMIAEGTGLTRPQAMADIDQYPNQKELFTMIKMSRIFQLKRLCKANPVKNCFKKRIAEPHSRFSLQGLDFIVVYQIVRGWMQIYPPSCRE